MKRQLLGLMLVCGSLLYGCSSGQEIAEPIENSQDNVEDVVVEKEYRELTPEELEAFLNPLVESCRVSQYIAYDKKFVKDQLEWYKDTTGNDFLETDDYQVTLRNKVEAADEASELFEYDFGRIAEAANATLSKPETTEQKTQDNNTQESKVIFYCTDETGYTWEPKVCARIYSENNHTSVEGIFITGTMEKGIKDLFKSGENGFKVGKQVSEYLKKVQITV